MPQSTPSTMAMLVVAVCIALPCLYVSGYATLVTAQDSPQDPLLQPQVAHYRVGGRSAEVLFFPVHWVDRHVRPRYWTTPGCLREG